MTHESKKLNQTKAHEGILFAETNNKQIGYMVKWDGCVHIETFSNGFTTDSPDSNEKHQNRDYLHICDLDLFIKQLTEIRDMAKKHFGEEWPNL